MMKKYLMIFLVLSIQMSANPMPLYTFQAMDHSSLIELFSYHSLHKETELGKKSLEKALSLINKHRQSPITIDKTLPVCDISFDMIVSLLVQQNYADKPELTKEQIAHVNFMASHLSNRTLAGYRAEKISDLDKLKSKEIDLGRAIFLQEFESDQDVIENYEAGLDIMALQILARLPKNPSHTQIIEAMNQFIFHEMRYRFPPHSLWAKDVDSYTFLPSVIDSRHGVCLGVSILYLSLAQRLNLPLEIITPPGHIYLRYTQGDHHINIETTARGIHVPDDRYLSVNTHSLQTRTATEVIGLSFMNIAATHWQKGRHEKAVSLYKKALPYLPDDSLLQQFLGLNLLFVGEKKQGEELLQKAAKTHLPYHIKQDTLIEDYFANSVDVEGIKTIYQEVDENRDSIIKKQTELQKITEKCPKFRDGWLQLAVSYMQLGDAKRGLSALEKYHALDATNPIVEYYLAILYADRLFFPKAYEHLNNCQKILDEQGHNPAALKNLRHALREQFVY